MFSKFLLHFVKKDLSGPKVAPMDHLAALVRNMRMEDNECEVEPVKFAFREAVKTDNDLNSAIDLLISRSLQEDAFASIAVQFCVHLSDVVAESVNCRSAFLKLLQANYKSKAKIHFLVAFRIACQFCDLSYRMA